MLGAYRGTLDHFETVHYVSPWRGRSLPERITAETAHVPAAIEIESGRNAMHTVRIPSGEPPA
jgi:hypothetical protein